MSCDGVSLLFRVNTPRAELTILRAAHLDAIVVAKCDAHDVGGQRVESCDGLATWNVPNDHAPIGAACNQTCPARAILQALYLAAMAVKRRAMRLELVFQDAMLPTAEVPAARI